MLIKAEYIDHMGSDLTVVNSARVSFDKVSELVNGEVPSTDVKLINYLATHNHFTPFTHPQITLRETVPIFVARQRFKHMVGFTYNEISRRYVKDIPEIFVPDEFREIAPNVKQGSAGTHPQSDYWKDLYESCIDSCLVIYEAMLNAGICPEQARMVLPQSMVTSYYVTGSLAAFARLYNQRIDPHAQVEIQVLAKNIEEIIAPLYPISWAALTSKK